MKFKFFALFAFVLSFAIACQQNSENNSDGSEAQEQAPQQNQQSPQQGQRVPNAKQPAMEVEEVSDEELQKFMTASQEVQAFSQQVQQQMISALEEQGMQPQRYGEIQQSQQNPGSGSDATSEEMQKFQKASQEVQKLQSQAQQQLQEKLSEAGFTQRRYQEISMMVQSDPELQQKFQSLQQGQR